jgi:hypothetical protein
MTHSGLFADTSATRSPRCTPSSASRRATTRAVASNSPYVYRRSPCTRNGTSGRNAFCAISSRIERMRCL